MSKTKKSPREILTPAQIVVRTFGGVRATARILKRAPGTVSRWQTMRHGRVPGKHHVALLAAAKELRKDLSPTDLVYGRVVAG